MPAQDFTLLEALESPSIAVYGNRISGFNLVEKDEGAGHRNRGGRPLLAENLNAVASIRAFRVHGGPCVRLPIPIFLSVPGNGTEITTPECGFAPGEVRKWTLPFGQPVLALDPSHGNAEDLLEAAATRGIDGGIALENPRYENGKLCVDAHIWARISVLGASAEFDKRIPICINIGQPCLTIWEIGFANLKVCYTAPNQICAKLCVGKFGLEKCWEKCIAIPLAASPATSFAGGSGTCACQEKPAEGATAELLDGCVSVTVDHGQACLHIPYAGDVCVSVPDSIPSGTVAEACVSVCKKFGVPVGAKVTVKVLGQQVACQSWGRCDC